MTTLKDIDLESDIPVAEFVGPEGSINASNNDSVERHDSNSTGEKKDTVAEPTIVVDSSVTSPTKESTLLQADDFGGNKAWNHGLCDCCSTFCQPLFWMACCCTPLVFAQIMTRMRLNWFGEFDRVHAGAKTFQVVALIFITYLSLSLLGLPFVGIAFCVYSVIAFSRARGAMRRRFKIPAKIFGCCKGALEDCCCVFWCGCCSSIQMARHTHNEAKYPYEACAPNGLPTYTPVLMTMDEGGEDDNSKTIMVV